MAYNIPHLSTYFLISSRACLAMPSGSIFSGKWESNKMYEHEKDNLTHWNMYVSCSGVAIYRL